MWWEFIKENKKVRKKERKHAFDKENDQEKKEDFRLKNINLTFNHFLSFVDLPKLNISKKMGLNV